MSEDLKDILSNLHSEVDQEALLKYLEGKLSAAEQHEVEKNTLGDAFEADALEGLQDISSQAKVKSLLQELNKDLAKKTARKASRPHKREAKLPPWLIITIIAVLAIAVISYFIIHKMKNP